MHLLAYLPDPTYPPLVDAAATGSSTAATPGCPAILERLRDVGRRARPRTTYAASPPARRRPAGRTSPTRWSRRGVVAGPQRGVRAVPQPGPAGVRQPLRRRRWTTMVPLVVGAGGVPVRRAPVGRGTARTRADRGARSRELRRRWGWPASRSTTRTTTPADARARCARSRGDLDLVVTGSSDYHGTGKVDHDLGCNTTAPEELARIRELAARGRGPRRHVSDLVDATLLTSAFVTLLRDHGPGRHGADLPVADRRPVEGLRAAGRLAGGHRLVRGDRRVRVLRPADPGLPAHLAAGPPVRRRAAAPARRPRAADRQREGADPAGRRPTSPSSRWAPRCSPGRARSWRRCCSPAGSTTSPTSPPSRSP